MERLRARVCGDYHKGEMQEALQMLRANGFRVSSTPVSGIPVTLYYGSDTYEGIQEIEEFVRNYQ